VQVGIPHQSDPLVYNPLVLFEINIKGSLGYSREEFDACIDFIQRKKLDLKPFAEETCKLEDIQQAFEGLDKGDAPAVKVIVTP
jgi:threonine dehydrogenase-like Zn-dependent dehydrogenase